MTLTPDTAAPGAAAPSAETATDKPLSLPFLGVGSVLRFLPLPAVDETVVGVEPYDSKGGENAYYKTDRHTHVAHSQLEWEVANAKAAILKAVPFQETAPAPSMECSVRDGMIVMHRSDDPKAVASIPANQDNLVWFRSLGDFDRETGDRMVWGTFRKTMDRLGGAYLGMPAPPLAPEMRWDLRSSTIEIDRVGEFRATVKVCRYYELEGREGLTDLYEVLCDDDLGEAETNALLWGVYKAEIAKAVQA